jgi:hypothetical protein
VAPSCIPIKITSSLSKTGLLDYFMSHIFRNTGENDTPAPDLFLFSATQMGFAARMTMAAFTGGAHILLGYGATLSALGAHHIIGDMRDLHAPLNYWISGQFGVHGGSVAELTLEQHKLTEGERRNAQRNDIFQPQADAFQARQGHMRHELALFRCIP